MRKQLSAGVLFLTCLPGLGLSVSATGCGCDPNSLAAKLIPPFAVTVAVDRENGVVGATFAFTAEVLGTDPATYEWDFGDGTTGSGKTASASYSEAGVYSVQVTVTDGGGVEVVGGTIVNVFDPSTAPGALDGILIGDVNEDGVVTLADVHLIMKAARALAPLSGEDAETAADVDQDGEITPADALVLAQAVAAGASFPSQITPTGGSPGVLVNIMSPNLFDTSAVVQVGVGDADPFEPFRGALGYATFAVPLDVAGSDPTAISAQTISIRLILDGTAVETFSFALIPTPPIVGAPGDQVLEVLNLALESSALLEQDLLVFLDSLSATGEETAVLQALAQVSTTEMTEARDGLAALLTELDDQTLRSLALAANANGLPDTLAELRSFVDSESARLKLGAAGRTAGDNVLAAVCGFKASADFLAKKVDNVMTGLSIAAAAVVAGGTVVANPPVVAGAIAVLSVTAQYGTASTIIGLVNEFVPWPDPALSVTALKTSLMTGEETEIEVEAGLDLGAGLCLGSTKKLLDLVIGKVTERLIKKVPVAKIAFQVTRIIPDLKLRNQLRQKILDAITGTIKTLIGQTLKLSGIDKALTDVRKKICDLVPEDALFWEVEIATDELSRFDAIGVNPGTLTPASDGSGDYECPDSGSSSVTITAERTLCDGKVLSGSTGVSCGLNAVTFTMGDNGAALDDIFELRVDGKTILTSSSPVTSTSTTVELDLGQHEMKMIGRAAPDDIGTYFVTVSGASIVSGPATSGSDLTAGTVFTWTIEVK